METTVTESKKQGPPWLLIVVGIVALVLALRTPNKQAALGVATPTPSRVQAAPPLPLPPSLPAPTHSLHLESEERGATIWDDEQSSTRIFCPPASTAPESCLVLPAAGLSRGKREHPGR